MVGLSIRVRAAWRAFRDPSLLDTPATVIVQHILPPEPVQMVAVEQDEPLPLPPRVDGQRFRVYRWNPVTAQHEVLYPQYAGQDRGAEARDVFVRATPVYAGESIVLMDGDAERGRK